MADTPKANLFYRMRDGLVVIFDTGRGERSVTNDAEAAVAEMVREGVSLDGKRVFYWDGQEA